MAATSFSFDKSDTGVANLALTHLGDKNIDDLLDGSREAKVLRRFYSQARDFLIQTNSWTWPNSIITLAPVTNDWPERWTYKYDYGNWLIFKGIINPNGADLRWDRKPIRYQVFGDGVYSHLAEAKGVVVTEQLEVQNWPAYFIEALAIDLAARAVMPLTKNVKLAGEVRKQRMSIVSTALATDANQDDDPPDFPAEGILARA